MTFSRRKILSQTLKWTASAVGMVAALTGGHWLLRPRKRSYPAHHSPYGEDSVPPELEAAIRTAGQKLTWDPNWSPRLIRPPGALEEDKFLAACIRCYRCQDVCEPGAIQFFTESAGKHYHTPYVDPAIKGCEPCMKCTVVCPSDALIPMTTKQRREIRMATIELREDLCLSFKAKRIRDEQAMMMELGREATESVAPAERRGPCGECYMFCPVRKHAIKLEPGAFLAPIIFPDECIGCGMCEEICRVMVRGEPAIRVVPIREWS